MTLTPGQSQRFVEKLKVRPNRLRIHMPAIENTLSFEQQQWHFESTILSVLIQRSTEKRGNKDAKN